MAFFAGTHKGLEGIARQFTMFASIGAVATVTHYTFFIALVQFTELGPVSSSMIGFVIGALVNYALNYRLTFRSHKRHRECIPKFFGVALFGLGLNTIIMIIATKILYLHYLVAQIVATGVVLIWNYTAHRGWTFRELTHAPYRTNR